MAKETTVRIILTMSPEMAEAVDDYRYAARMPTRMDALRSLLAKALTAEGITSPSSAGPAKKPGARAKKP
jgi:hypothetical protein